MLSAVGLGKCKSKHEINGSSEADMNLIEQYSEKKAKEYGIGREIGDFKPGDTVRVFVKIVEGATERIQAFEGVCIARRNSGLGSTFTVRKISYGEGVERLFYLYSPHVQKVEVKKVGKVRRAKLYYLRNLRGKAARIVEKTM